MGKPRGTFQFARTDQCPCVDTADPPAQCLVKSGLKAGFDCENAGILQGYITFNTRLTDQRYTANMSRYCCYCHMINKHETLFNALLSTASSHNVYTSVRAASAYRLWSRSY